MASNDALFRKRKIGLPSHPRRLPPDSHNLALLAVLGSRSVGTSPTSWCEKHVLILVASPGKSSLVTQFVENKFVAQYYPTIENTFTKAIKHNGQEYECDIIDTAGQDEYSLLNSRHAVGIHGYILVYSVASRNSFDMVRTVHDKIVNQSGMATIPCVVVGQKCDLAEARYVYTVSLQWHDGNNWNSLETRQVPAAEGKKLADALGSAWLETSARQNSNIGACAVFLCSRSLLKPSAFPSQSIRPCAR